MAKRPIEKASSSRRAKKLKPAPIPEPSWNNDSESSSSVSGSADEDSDEEEEEDDEEEDEDAQRRAMLAMLEAHGRAFMGVGEAGPSSSSKAGKLTGKGKGKAAVIEDEEEDSEEQEDEEDEDFEGFDDDDGWNGIEGEEEEEEEGTIVPEVVFDGSAGKDKQMVSKADRKKFMSAKSAKMLADEDFSSAASARGKKRAADGEEDDEDQSNANLDKTLQTMLLTKLLPGAANHSRPVEKRNALKGRLMELADMTTLGRGATEAGEKAYDAQPLRIRSGIRKAQAARAEKARSDAQAAGSWVKGIGGLMDGGGAGKARKLGNKHERGKAEDGRKRDRGLGMGIGKFEGGMLKLSKKEIAMGDVQRGGGERKPGKKGGKKGNKW